MELANKLDGQDIYLISTATDIRIAEKTEEIDLLKNEVNYNDP